MSSLEDFEGKRLRVIYCCKPAIHYKESDVDILLSYARSVEAQNAELLEALKSIDQGFYSHRLTIKEAQAIARKAIAKAEGRE